VLARAHVPRLSKERFLRQIPVLVTPFSKCITRRAVFLAQRLP